jgi:sRNA-binding carbon storage regulator CsrA
VHREEVYERLQAERHIAQAGRGNGFLLRAHR